MPISITCDPMFALGRAARLLGLPRTSCPYGGDTMHGARWRSGWDSLGPDCGTTRGAAVDRQDFRPMPLRQEIEMHQLARAGASLVALARRYDRTIHEIRTRLAAARISIPAYAYEDQEAVGAVDTDAAGVAA